jgi:hypothetical protein
MSIPILEAEEVAAGAADVVVPIGISMMTVEINRDRLWRGQQKSSRSNINIPINSQLKEKCQSATCVRQ